MARHGGRRDEHRTRRPKSESLVLNCSLCGHRRSSRRMLLGPENVLDRFICSRTDCWEFKSLLEKFSNPSPIVQINHYNSNSPSVIKDTPVKTPETPECSEKARVEDSYRRPSEKISEPQAAELPGESSTNGRAELAGDFKFRSIIGSLRDWFHNGTPPPSVNRATKPKLRR